MSGTARERDEYDKVNRVCGTELDNFADLNSKSYLLLIYNQLRSTKGIT